LSNWLLGSAFIFGGINATAAFLWFVEPATRCGFTGSAQDAKKALVGCEESLDLIIEL
jgi:hypothetical protein